jgi:mono/diheme cytochrome c family protein
VLALMIGAVAFSYTGIYNVAARVPHTRVMAWFLDNTMHHSVRAHARSVGEAPQLDQSRAQRGFQQFQKTCVPCHGAPGTHGEAGGDQLPEPPPLRAAAREWNAPELFWIIKNGIKMTAMPSFDAVRSDDEIWDIVAFLERLPEMTPQEYGQLYGSDTPEVRLSVGPTPPDANPQTDTVRDTETERRPLNR